MMGQNNGTNRTAGKDLERTRIPFPEFVETIRKIAAMAVAQGFECVECLRPIRDMVTVAGQSAPVSCFQHYPNKLGEMMFLASGLCTSCQEKQEQYTMARRADAEDSKSGADEAEKAIHKIVDVMSPVIGFVMRDASEHMKAHGARRTPEDLAALVLSLDPGEIAGILLAASARSE